MGLTAYCQTCKDKTMDEDTLRYCQVCNRALCSDCRAKKGKWYYCPDCIKKINKAKKRTT